VPRATSKVYVRASTVTKLDATGLPPFAVPVTVMSVSSKFSTSSLNVAVNVTGLSLVVVPLTGVMVTVGTILSTVNVVVSLAVLPSTTALAGMVTVSCPPAMMPCVTVKA